MSTVFSGPRAQDLEWLIPTDVRVPDGRAVDAALLVAMIGEWHRIVGGTTQYGVWGAMSEEERRAARRRGDRPGSRSGCAKREIRPSR